MTTQRASPVVVRFSGNMVQLTNEAGGQSPFRPVVVRCNSAVLSSQKSLKDAWKLVRFVPFNPVDKYTCATVQETATGRTIRLLKGSPQVRACVAGIAHMCGCSFQFVTQGLLSLRHLHFPPGPPSTCPKLVAIQCQLCELTVTFLPFATLLRWCWPRRGTRRRSTRW